MIVTSVYVIGGGLIAVMYTDALQGAIVLCGMTFLLCFTYFTLGGVTVANTNLTNLPQMVSYPLSSQGWTGWTSFPSFGSPIWLTVVTTVILGVGIGVLAEPQLALRFLTAKDEKHLKRAIPIGAIFVLMTTGVAYTVGSLTNVYFYQQTGQVAFNAVPNHNIDLVMPTFINSATPDLFIVVFMVVLLAAAMSSLSSIFHTMGTAAGFDFWGHVRRKIRPNAEIVRDSKATILTSRIGMGIMIMISVALAYVMPASIIARATIMFMGLMASAVLPSYAHALFSEKPSLLAAKASLVVGAISWFIWTAFVNTADSGVLGISNYFFGQPSMLQLPWQNIDPLVIGLSLSLVTFFVVWFIDKHFLADRQAKSEGKTGTVQ